MIDGHTEAHLLNTAKNVVLTKTKDSIVLDVEAEKRIPKFDQSELTIGKVLGRGGFCVVSEVVRIKLRDVAGKPQASGVGSERSEDFGFDDEHRIHNITQDRGFMQTYCVRQGKDCRYAIKCVQDSSRNDAQTFINAVVDLAVESRFLAVVRHPNIIKMRAVASGTPYTARFFVVLDKLYDILSTRLHKWKAARFKGIKKLLDRGGKKELAFWCERCTVAYDLASALKYLHDLNIIYRDLKPDNIGFDVRGDVKIFDFGLAREYDRSISTSADGTYKMTGDTGSPRYMAPEVALEKPYNNSVDVYSFAILTWQILEMAMPFEGFTMAMLRKKVVLGGSRPKCDSSWPQGITKILQSAWNGQLQKRPTMDDVSVVLRDEINRISDQEVVDIIDASRKSEMSMRMGGS